MSAPAIRPYSTTPGPLGKAFQDAREQFARSPHRRRAQKRVFSHRMRHVRAEAAPWFQHPGMKHREVRKLLPPFNFSNRIG